MATDTPRNNFKKFYLTAWGICFFVALIALVLYKSGFRLSNSLEPVKVGSIELSSNSDSYQVFLNNRERKVSVTDNKFVLRNLTPGVHSVVVSKDGYWPWAKTVNVAQNNIRSLYAFMFPIEGIKLEPVTKDTDEYKNLLKNFIGLVLPEVEVGSPSISPDESTTVWLKTYAPKSRISTDKSTALYVEGNTVYVVWISDSIPTPHYFCQENPCKQIMPVIVANAPVKSVDFYKGRPDLIMFTSGGVIYAIEVDHEGTQNFQPLYKGVDPYFYQTDSGEMFIMDTNSIHKANF